MCRQHQRAPCHWRGGGKPCCHLEQEPWVTPLPPKGLCLTRMTQESSPGADPRKVLRGPGWEGWPGEQTLTTGCGSAAAAPALPGAVQLPRRAATQGPSVSGPSPRGGLGEPHTVHSGTFLTVPAGGTLSLFKKLKHPHRFKKSQSPSQIPESEENKTTASSGEFKPAGPCTCGDLGQPEAGGDREGQTSGSGLTCALPLCHPRLCPRPTQSQGPGVRAASCTWTEVLGRSAHCSCGGLSPPPWTALEQAEGREGRALD